MEITFEIDYKANQGQSVCVLGSMPQVGSWDESRALHLSCHDESKWHTTILLKEEKTLEYCYLIKEGDVVVRREWGKARNIELHKAEKIYFQDVWHDEPAQKHLYSTAFTDGFMKHKTSKVKPKYFDRSIVLNLDCPYAESDQAVVLTGESHLLGNWDINKALHLKYIDKQTWEIVIDAEQITQPAQYKFAIVDSETKDVVSWEEGENRMLIPLDVKGDFTQIQELKYKLGRFEWKCGGVAIPVFSLRSQNSFGIGEFSDLRKMIDWAKATGMKIIQVLPINDTTVTRTWTDSYPYNAISIYALHPLYLGLKDFPLADKAKLKKYKQRAQELNALSELDYEKVSVLKNEYLNDFFSEQGEPILNSKEFKAFYKYNEYWLFAYACFTALRDEFGTTDYSQWKKYTKYNKNELLKLINENELIRKNVNQAYFTQFLLHQQLSAVKHYAHDSGVVLKGDIPIGVSRGSVEAWTEPNLFNLDTQTGAPPDDFSVNGQNWGFPTYNWTEMAEHHYEWWVNRFKKMADYFDAYRIDHILGFFRIWEIPLHSVQGLLGYFSPALPFSIEEIIDSGIPFDEQRMALPYIYIEQVKEIFGEYAEEVIGTYFNRTNHEQYELKEFCNTQQKIKAFFEAQLDNRSLILRNGLYNLCNEVLFVRDKYEPNKYHPRITAQQTYSYKSLDEHVKQAFNRLYNYFFYERHTDFWREQAMVKLPVLIDSTDMLVCGEDLGMIPSCVHPVMNQLQILSLEIERMPKEIYRQFADLKSLPYMSVCTTSTHDMSPLRLWWEENREITQQYYNEVLHMDGVAPEVCFSQVCGRIIENHLDSPAMMAILPLQDWLSVSDKLRRENPEEERINVPAVSNHYWQYRIHLNIEELLDATDFNIQIRNMLEKSGR